MLLRQYLHIAIATTVAMAAACTRAPQTARGAILITLDTTRADALGCYGGSPRVSPHLDLLAGESLVFDSAHSVAPLTLPAHASMLTGLYPPRHGVHDNGVAVLPPAARTLAECAREAGLQTGAVVAASVLDRAFALDQGFESWDQPSGAERSAREVLELGSRWLARRDRARPFFLWLHLYDPHLPYTPPRALLDQAGGDAYLGEVAAMDLAIGEFLAPLRADGSLDELLLLVVADHGESLGEHGEPTHGALLYESALRVPLLLRLPGGRRAGERSAAQVSVVDVFPTVLEALGLERPQSIDGVSLWLADPPAERGTYSETYSGWLNYGWSPLAAWSQAGSKYLHSSAPEFYRLDVDAGEQRNLVEFESAAAERGRRAIAEVWSRPKLAEEPAAFSAELMGQLRALGYAAGGATPERLPSPLEPSARPAPQERSGELLPLLQAGALAEARRFPEAIALLRAILAENPANTLALDYLGFDLMNVGEFAEALSVFARRLECGPARADTLLNQGLCHDRLGDAQAGIESLERALAVDPQHPRVRAELIGMLRRAGREDEALALEAADPH